MKRFIALLLLIALSLPCVSCTPDEGVVDDPNAKPVVDNSDKVVMSYDGYEITSGMYAFILSRLKTFYLYNLQLYGETEYIEDTESFWNTTENGKTLAQAVTEDINAHCKMILISEKMSAEYGVELDDEALEAVEDVYNDFVTSYGGEKELEVYINRYGIDLKELRKYLERDELLNCLQDKLCAEGGLCAVDDSAVYAEIDKQYIKAKHIYLKDDSDGDKAFDKAKDMLAKINSGEKKYEDFVSSSADDSATAYPNGFLVNLETTDESYVKALSALKAGECEACETEDGAYIICRLETTDDDRKTKFDDVWKQLADQKFADIISARYDMVELDNTELGKYDIITADLIQ